MSCPAAARAWQAAFLVRAMELVPAAACVGCCFVCRTKVQHGHRTTRRSQVLPQASHARLAVAHMPACVVHMLQHAIVYMHSHLVQQMGTTSA